MPDNRYYTTLDADTGVEVDIISCRTATPKTKVLRELIQEALLIRDIRETSLCLLREKRSEEVDKEDEIGKLIEFMPKLLCFDGDRIDEKEFFTDEITYLLVAMTIYLLDKVIPTLLSELEI